MPAEQPLVPLILPDRQPLAVYVECVICGAPATIRFDPRPLIVCGKCCFEGLLVRPQDAP
jgi:hypothetical protein